MVRRLQRDLPELLSFFAFPRHLWRKLRTTNVIERCFVEVRRRTRPMVCFVNVESVDRIIYSIFQRFNLEWKTRTLNAIYTGDVFRRHSTEWSVDFLFKKPWTISDKMEFMLGIGPEWIHSNAYGLKMNSVGAEVAPDFMFWPAKKHRFGWYLEPSYEYKFGPGHEHSLGISGGLLISIP